MPGLRPFLKSLLCTGNLSTAWALHTRRRREVEFSLPGLVGTLRMRTGTSDADFFRLLAHGYEFREYRIPIECAPRTILDVGANVGVVSINLARKYPRARIYSFEPLPENFKLLQHNVAQFPNITPIPFGLGAATRERTYYWSDDPRNLGGGGFHDHGPPNQKTSTLPVVSVTDALERFNIENIDIIKIDAEGAETDVLTAMPAALLARVLAIVGELHGDPAPLLAHLEPWFKVERALHCAALQWFTAVNRRLTALTTAAPPLPAATTTPAH